MHERLVAEPIKLTYADFCALPDDGRRYEILDGDLYMSPSPEIPHQDVVGNLFSVLREHVRKRRLGRVFVAPVDVILDEHEIVEPDLIYVSKERSSIVTRKNIQGSPDLLVEVLSPSSAERDLRDKRNIYARAGVDHYWIVDPDGRTVTELVRIEKAYAVAAQLAVDAVFTPRLFPDLRIELRELWS